MTSGRYIFLVTIYLIGYYLVEYHFKDDRSSAIHSHLFLLSISTFAFIYGIKYFENNKCTKNKLESKYLLSQSIFYTIIAVLSQYLYDFFIEKDCSFGFINYINNIQSIRYIPEAFFIAGIVLLLNQLSYIIYPKCEIN